MTWQIALGYNHMLYTMTPSLYNRKCLCLKGHSEKVKKGTQRKKGTQHSWGHFFQLSKMAASMVSRSPLIKLMTNLYSTILSKQDRSCWILINTDYVVLKNQLRAASQYFGRIFGTQPKKSCVLLNTHNVNGVIVKILNLYKTLNKSLKSTNIFAALVFKWGRGLFCLGGWTRRGKFRRPRAPQRFASTQFPVSNRRGDKIAVKKTRSLF